VSDTETKVQQKCHESDTPGLESQEGSQRGMDTSGVRHGRLRAPLFESGLEERAADDRCFGSGCGEGVDV
jgi:hypothetical protein